MSLSFFLTYIQRILLHVPWEHWAIIDGVSLLWTVFLLCRKRCSVYGAIVFGITVFYELVLVDTAVVIRFLGEMPHKSGIDLWKGFARFLQGNPYGQAEVASNVVFFVPLGFFLSEFLASTKRFGIWRRIGLSTLAAFGISLCIEALQLILHVGYFELTDLVMNTMGGFLGAGASAFLRFMFGKDVKFLP